MKIATSTYFDTDPGRRRLGEVLEGLNPETDPSDYEVGIWTFLLMGLLRILNAVFMSRAARAAAREQAFRVRAAVRDVEVWNYWAARNHETYSAWSGDGRPWRERMGGLWFWTAKLNWNARACVTSEQQTRPQPAAQGFGRLGVLARAPLAPP